MLYAAMIDKYFKMNIASYVFIIEELVGCNQFICTKTHS